MLSLHISRELVDVCPSKYHHPGQRDVWTCLMLNLLPKEYSNNSRVQLVPPTNYLGLSLPYFLELPQEERLPITIFLLHRTLAKFSVTIRGYYSPLL